jgi:hypothetical protein
MKYISEMASKGMMDIHKDRLRRSKLLGSDKHRHRQQGDFVNLYLYFQKKQKEYT